MATLSERTEDAHQHGLTVRAALAAVAVAVFANDDGRPYRSLRVIVFKRNSRLVQEREQVVAVTPVAARLVLLVRQPII